MKIVQFEDFFHPEAGYHTNVISKYFCKFGNEVTILTSEYKKSPKYLKTFFNNGDMVQKDKLYERETGTKIIRLKTRFYYSGRAIISVFSLLKNLKDIKPDIFIVNGNETYVGIISILFYRRLSCPLIYTSSMVEMASENRFNWLFRVFYRTLITPLITRNKILVIRRQDDPYVQKNFSIPLSLSPYISMGVDRDLFYHQDKKDDIRNLFNIDIDSFVVIYAGKLDHSKGIKTIMDVWSKKIDSLKKTVLLIVGNPSELSDEFYRFVQENENEIHLFPTQKHSDLAKFYWMSDIAIFPKQISLSFFNCQACGLPVIAESNNINDDRLSHGNGFVFKEDDRVDFKNTILKVAEMELEEYSNLVKNSLKFIDNKYDYRLVTIEYLSVINTHIKTYTLGS